MTQPTSTIDYLVADRGGDRLQHHLDKIPAMKLVAAHKWRWAIDEFAADVVAEPNGAIHISLDVANSPAKFAALATNHNLPGNLRFATRQLRSLLLADTQLDGDAHLPQTFDALKSGLLAARGLGSPSDTRKPLSAEEVRAVVAACRWPEGGIVHLEDAWEFPVRLRGNSTPVRAVIDGAELRMYRRVLTGIGKELNRDAVSCQALRFNHQLRHARLSAVDGAIVAESRLHGAQLTPAWLETAAWAVAVACRHTEAILSILAENDEVASDYTATFLRAKQ